MHTVSALKGWFNSRWGYVPMPHIKSLEQVRGCALAALEDCETPACERARSQLRRAVSVEELWLLRIEIYQVIARAYCQFEAGRRLNALAPAFDGQIPERLLHGV